MIRVNFTWNGIKTMVRKYYPEAKAFKKINHGFLSFKVGQEIMTMRLSKEGLFFYNKRNNLVRKEIIPEDYGLWGEQSE